MYGWLLAALFGCPSEPPPDPLACDDVAWATHAQPFVEGWCLDCHHSARVGAERNGAPSGVDFDDPGQVVALAGGMAAMATGESPRMPPAGGPSLAERVRFADWVACGAPPPPDDRCAGLTLEGDLTTSGAPADLCPDTRWLTGSLVVDGSTDGVSCLCGVGGDVRIGASGPEQVVLPELEVVGGALEMEQSPVVVLEVPALRRAGRVRLTGNPAFRGVPLASLEEVSGSLVVRGNPSLDGVDLRGLGRVGGLLDLGGNASMRWILGPSGEGVLEGGLELSDTPELLAVDGFDRIADVVGPVDVRRSAVQRIAMLPAARRVGGVSFVDLPELREIDALGEVERVDGSVWIAHVGPLEDAALLGRVTTITGSVVLDGVAGARAMGLPALLEVGGGLSLAANPDLEDLGSMRHVTHLQDLSITDDPVLASLEGLHGLEAVAGHVRIVGNASLTDLSGLRSLRSIGGDLILQENPALTELEGLETLLSVGGDVFLEGDSLDVDGAMAFLAHVQVGGQVLVTP